MDKKEVKKILADADGKYIEVTFANGSWYSGKYNLKTHVFHYPARLGMDRMVLDEDDYEIIKDIKVDE